MAVDFFTQTPHRAHGHTRQTGQLAIADHTGHTACHDDAGEQETHHLQVKTLGQQVLVYVVLAQQGTSRLQHSRCQQPGSAQQQMASLGCRRVQ